MADEFEFLSVLLNTIEQTALAATSVTRELNRDRVLAIHAFESMREITRHVANVRHDIAKARLKADLARREANRGKLDAYEASDASALVWGENFKEA